MLNSLNILDAELAQYRALNTSLSGPLPHLEVQHSRAQRDRLADIPHFDAEARARIAYAARLTAADRIVGTIFEITAVLALTVMLGSVGATIGGML